MSDAVRAEWTKLTAIRSTPWALLALVALTVLVSILITSGAQTDGCPSGGMGCDDDLMEMALGGVYLGQFAVAALGVMAISSEFASGMLRTTFAATPRRRDVLAAKALVVGGLVFACALVAGALSYLAGLSLLQGNGYTEANGYSPPSGAEVFRGVAGTAVYLAALALLSLGIGTVLRHTAAAISAVLALLWVPLIVVSMLPRRRSGRSRGSARCSPGWRSSAPSSARTASRSPPAPACCCSAPTRRWRWARASGCSSVATHNGLGPLADVRRAVRRVT